MKTGPYFTPPMRRRLHSVRLPLGDLAVPPNDVVRRFFRRVDQVIRRHRGNHRSMIVAGAVATLLVATTIAGVVLLVTGDSGDGTAEPQGDAADNSPAAPATSSDTGEGDAAEPAGAGADSIGASPGSADPAGGIGGPSADEPSNEAPVVAPPGQPGRPGRDGAPAPTPTPIINLPTPPVLPTTPPLPTPIIGLPTPPALPTPGVSGLPTLAVPTVAAPSLAVPSVAAPTLPPLP